MKNYIRLFILCGIFLCLLNPLRAQMLFGLTPSQMLAKFDANRPIDVFYTVQLHGIMSGQELVGLDFRPQTGEMYAIGYNAALQQAQLYTLDSLSGLAEPRGNLIQNIVLEGRIGFDFNANIDQIRVVAWGNQNIRLHPETGAIVAFDEVLKYGAGDIHAGKNPTVGSIAYSNSYIASPVANLYVIDDNLKTLALQNPANSGTLRTIGPLGVTLPAGSTTDIDIFYGKHTLRDKGYLLVGTPTDSYLYNMNLATGAVTLEDDIGDGLHITDMAVVIDRVPPAPNGPVTFGYTTNNNLISFYPGTPDFLLDSRQLTGLAPGQTLVGMDFRPADGRLYGLGYNPSTGISQLYVINTATAVAFPYGSQITGMDLRGKVGFDFNPILDRIRVVTSNERNYRINPFDGSVLTDQPLRFGAGDTAEGKNPTITALAFNNNYFGATFNKLYLFDDSLNHFINMDNPASGILETVGTSFLVDTTANQTSDLDIYYNPGDTTNVVFLHTNPNGSFDKLYALNINNGGATDIDKVGYGIPLLNIAVSLHPLSVGIQSPAVTLHGAEVYPNPLAENSIIEFEVPETGPVTVQVTDLTGREVQTLLNSARLDSRVHRLEWNTAGLEPGLYLVVIRSGARYAVLKVIR